jgi:NADPH:quinone reductase-like Zn-dependent oxidoreductase
VPLATIGAFPALLLTGRPIGLSALIGFLMLIGIVVTNAIVLLDLVERLRADAAPSADKLRLLGELAGSGALRVPIQGVYSIDQAGDALQAFQQGTRGKIVLSLPSDVADGKGKHR